MRVLAIAACLGFFCTTGAAFAADCTKGMLWPYVRNPGDCLTDDEIRTGKLGAYNGTINTAPDVSAIKLGTPAAGPAPVPGTAVSPGPTPASVSAPAVASDGSCHKGWLWPFVRDQGVCLTDTERKNGQVGVFGGGAAPAVGQANNAAPSTVSVAPTSTAAVAAPEALHQRLVVALCARFRLA